MSSLGRTLEGKMKKPKTKIRGWKMSSWAGRVPEQGSVVCGGAGLGTDI